MDTRYFTFSGTTLFFSTRDEIIKVKLGRVAYFEADSNYCNVYFINGTKATLFASLNSIENLLNDKFRDSSTVFIRIGKRYIVNTQYIFQINVLKQKILFSDFLSPVTFEISVAKEALKKLKLLYGQK